MNRQQAATLPRLSRSWKEHRDELLANLTRWAPRAACLGKDEEKGAPVFFPSNEVRRGGPDPREEAKAICATCPVREECLEYALAFPEPLGIWGGMDEEERRRLRRAHRR